MNSTISIVLPVHNAERTICARLGELLELLSELSDWFEILVVDDGSSDLTSEVAMEMMHEFPQIRVLHQGMRSGIAKATELGMSQAQGDIVFVFDERAPFRENDLRKLWRMRNDEQLMMARADQQPRPLRPALMRQLMAWGAAVQQLAAQQGEFGGLQMIRRGAMEQLREGAGKVEVESSNISRTDMHMVNREQPTPFLAKLKELAMSE